MKERKRDYTMFTDAHKQQRGGKKRQRERESRGGKKRQTKEKRGVNK